MRRQATCLIGCVFAGYFAVACGAGTLDSETALTLARAQQRVLAANWLSDNEVVTVRAGYEVERTSALDLASAEAYPKGDFLGARLMQKLDSEGALFKLARNEYIPASSIAPGHVMVEYELRANSANASYDQASRLVTIRVTAPVIESFDQFVERGDAVAVARFQIQFRPTEGGSRLLKAVDELRKEGPIDARHLDSPGDAILAQLLAVEQNMKRHETRYVRFERGDSGWQVSKLQ